MSCFWDFSKGEREATWKFTRVPAWCMAMPVAKISRSFSTCTSRGSPRPQLCATKEAQLELCPVLHCFAFDWQSEALPEQSPGGCGDSVSLLALRATCCWVAAGWERASSLWGVQTEPAARAALERGHLMTSAGGSSPACVHKCLEPGLDHVPVPTSLPSWLVLHRQQGAEGLCKSPEPGVPGPGQTVPLKACCRPLFQ